MSSQFAEWVEIAEETGGHLDFSIYDVLHDWRQDRAQRDAERDDLVALLRRVKIETEHQGFQHWHIPPETLESVVLKLWELDATISRARGEEAR